MAGDQMNDCELTPAIGTNFLASLLDAAALNPQTQDSHHKLPHGAGVSAPLGYRRCDRPIAHEGNRIDL